MKQVAEIEVARHSTQIVGMIRGCIKTVTCGKKLSRNSKTTPVPLLTKVAYVLGLRVSPSHRRMKMGLKLVNKIEEWLRENGGEYSYIATESDNTASVNLFIDKCSYSKFRTPSILVHPVFAHRLHLSKRFKLTRSEAEFLYRRRRVLPQRHWFHLKQQIESGTFLAIPADHKFKCSIISPTNY